MKWSNSLDSDARTCARRVFLKNRFACARAARGSERHEAYLLKQGLDLPAWVGRAVHRCIADCIVPSLQNHDWPDFAGARDFLVRLMERQAAFSRAGEFRLGPKSKFGSDFCVLRADLLGAGVETHEIRKATAAALEALTVCETKHSELLKVIQAASWVAAEKPIRFRLDEGILVEAIPDLMFFNVAGYMNIVDWKVWTGTGSVAREQLHVYAFAALKSGWWRNLSAQTVSLGEANLINGELRLIPLSDTDLELADEKIFTGCELLEPILSARAADCEPNFFAPTSRPGACEHCCVLELCNGTYKKAPLNYLLPFEHVSS